MAVVRVQVFRFSDFKKPIGWMTIGGRYLNHPTCNAEDYKSPVEESCVVDCPNGVMMVLDERRE